MNRSRRPVGETHAQMRRRRHAENQAARRANVRARGDALITRSKGLLAWAGDTLILVQAEPQFLPSMRLA